MRIIVTGAAGFIGSNLLPRLLDKGHEVLGLDNFFLGKEAYLPPQGWHPNFQFKKFDLLERESLIRTFQEFGPERVWHLAANSDISFGTEHTDFDLKGGTVATANVLEAMRLSGAKQLVFPSSGSIYGEPTVHPTPEDYGPLMPISLYAASKLACEGLVTAYAHNYGIQAWIFRFGNIVGPNPTHGVIYDFARRLLEDPSQLRILGDGRQAKPYVHVQDCLDGIMHGQAHSSAPVNLFNLATEGSTSVRAIARWVFDALGIQPGQCKVNFTGGARGWKGDVPFVSMDSRKLRALGWVPRRTSDESVQQAVKEIVAQLRGESLDDDPFSLFAFLSDS